MKGNVKSIMGSSTTQVTLSLGHRITLIKEQKVIPRLRRQHQAISSLDQVTVQVKAHRSCQILGHIYSKTCL